MQLPSYCEGQDKVKEDYMKQAQKKNTKVHTYFWEKNVVWGRARPDSFLTCLKHQTSLGFVSSVRLWKVLLYTLLTRILYICFCVPVLRKGSTGGLLEMLFVMLFSLSKDLITLICQGRRIAAFYHSMKRLKCPSIGFLSGLFRY